MYHATKNKSFKTVYHGFTLIELLVSIAIVGIISVVSVKSLYDIVSIRAKQQTIEDSSDSFRIISKLLTKAVIESEKIFISEGGEEIQITKFGKNICQTIKYDSVTQSVLHTKNTGNPCTLVPPTVDDTITNEDFIITTFSLSPKGEETEVVLLEMEGYYKNSLGDHPLKYSITITKRSSI